MLSIQEHMQTAAGHIVRSPSTAISDSCVSFLRLGCLPWRLEERATAVPIFKHICMTQDGNVQFAYRNKTVALLQMAHTPEACEKTCRGFVCGSAHIARGKLGRCCLWAQAFYVALVREHAPPLDLGDAACEPRTQNMPLIDCNWMHKIADEICPSAPGSVCAATGGFQIEALELDDSLLANLLSMSTIMALVLGFVIAQVCILGVNHASLIHKGALHVPGADADSADAHAMLLPPMAACMCK